MAQPTIVSDMPPPKTEAPESNGSSLPPAGASTAEASSASSRPTTKKAESNVATLSNAWEFDDLQPNCVGCRNEFGPLNRRHHCRLCGKIFCGNCSGQRALIPPSSIVLVPDGGKKAKPRRDDTVDATGLISFSPDPDPDRMLTYLDENQQLLYGKGLEERFKLAREPLRVCGPCFEKVMPLQEELRNSNSNAMRFNHVDPTDSRRMFNSPLAFTLGHEVRKAAYTLNNLLPLPKKMGSVVDVNSINGMEGTGMQQCKEDCSTVSPSLSGVDGVQIPAKLLENARGVAVLTAIKGGFGLAGAEFGTGLVVARLGDRWSAPCAIGMAGVSWGALIGAQVSDHVFLLMTDAAVDMMFNGSGSVQLGADVGVAIGPVGRALEADFGASPGSMAPIYTYSLSKGFYAGVSLDGKILTTRHRVNERFYGRLVSGAELLSGSIPTPPAARPLYDALTRCHVYASGSVPNLRDLHGGQYNTNNINTTNTNMNGSLDANGENAWESEYGEVAGGMINGMGPSHPLAPSEEQMIAAFNTASHPSA